MDIQHNTSMTTLDPAFYAGLTTEAEQAWSMQWDIWYIAKALTMAFPLYITRVNDSANKGFDLAIDSGLVVMHVNKINIDRGRNRGMQGYTVHINGSQVVSSPMFTAIAQSIKPSYIVKVLTDKSKDQYRQVQDTIDRLNSAASTIVFTIADRLADSAQGRVKEKAWTLDSEDATALLLNSFEGKTFTPTIRSGLEGIYRKHLEREKVLHHERSTLHSRLIGNKWLIGYDSIRSNYIVGAVDSTWVTSLTDRRVGGEYISLYEVNKASPCPPLLPLRSYKSLDHLPDSIRDSIKGAMLMTKIQMGEAFYGKAVDAEGLIPESIAKPSGTYTIFPNGVWFDEGGIVYKETHNSRAILFELLDQT